MECPVCHEAMRPLFLKDGYEILGCEGCGHRSADVGGRPGNIPLPYPGDDLFWMLLRKQG